MEGRTNRFKVDIEVWNSNEDTKVFIYHDSVANKRAPYDILNTFVWNLSISNIIIKTHNLFKFS